MIKKLTIICQQNSQSNRLSQKKGADSCAFFLIMYCNALSALLFHKFQCPAFAIAQQINAGCFYIGSNSAINFLYTRNVRDADIYFGFTVSQLKGTKNDWFIRRRKEANEQKDNKKPDCEKM